MTGMKRLLLILPLLLAGCGQGGSAEGNQKPSLSAPGASRQNPKDPTPANDSVAVLNVYQISVPMGKISGREEFWKHVNEQCVDVGVYDTLYRNGVRVGITSFGDLGYVQSILEQPALLTQVSTYAGSRVQTVELEMNKDVKGQDVFYYDGNNQLQGRTYDRSTNLLTISFQPVPRKPGAVRVKLCPMVRALRQRLEFTASNGEREVQLVYPERLYDMRLEAEIPMGSFLVVAPSPEAANTTSIGHAFLTREGPAELQEQVLLLTPRMVVSEKK